MPNETGTNRKSPTRSRGTGLEPPQKLTTVIAVTLPQRWQLRGPEPIVGRDSRDCPQFCTRGA